MAMDYEELGKVHRQEEWGKGVTDATVRSLQEQGLCQVPETTEGSVILPKGVIRLPEITTIGMSSVDMVVLASTTIGLNLDPWGREILQKATASPKQQALRPIAMNARTMGLGGDDTKQLTAEEIWNKALEFGDKVSVETMLRIAIEAAKGNIQVERGKPLVGITEPVADSYGRLYVLRVGRIGISLWLGACYVAYPGHRWFSDAQFVVSLRE